jgi:WS/DGAT/MGAT family acyltransferase
MVGRRSGATVNDVLLAAITGAFRRYLQDQGDAVDNLCFRAAVPVSLRSPSADVELGNRFGVVLLPLPVDIADPAERLSELKRRMDERKGSLEVPVAFAVVKALGKIPAQIQNAIVSSGGTKATAVMTNVMGPQQRLYLAGAPLEALMFWVPKSGQVGVGVSILSYAGQVRLGAITDAGLVPDPGALIAAFHAEFDGLLALGGKEGPATQEA